MKKRPRFHPEAEREFLAAIDYYLDRSPRAAERFEEEIRRLVAQIVQTPRRHGPWRHGTRRARAQRFPYLVIFAERPKDLYIVAVAHRRRKPDYWLERVD